MRWLLLLAVWGSMPGCALFAPRTPCSGTDGAHECSMVPAEYWCECDGDIEPANEADNEYNVCGHIRTVCRGTVIARHQGGMLQQLFTRTSSTN